MADLRVFLTGTFRIETSDGQDLTPKGMKECGLVALVVCAASGKRTRAWLQGKLWSDREREQASASLRQALRQIRKRLGPYGDCFTADRTSVQCDLDRIECVEDSASEFLEGLDLRDAEFEQWLGAERDRRGGVHTRQEVIVSPQVEPVLPARKALERQAILIRTQPDRSSATWWAERLVADVMIRSLSE